MVLQYNFLLGQFCGGDVLSGSAKMLPACTGLHVLSSMIFSGDSRSEHGMKVRSIRQSMLSAHSVQKSSVSTTTINRLRQIAGSVVAYVGYEMQQRAGLAQVLLCGISMTTDGDSVARIATICAFQTQVGRTCDRRSESVTVQ